MREKNVPVFDPLAVIKDEARAIAILYGARWCEEANDALIERIVDRLGGFQMYIPRQSLNKRRRRDRDIQSCFTGRNIRELARKFNVSERTIRRVLNADAQV